MYLYNTASEVAKTVNLNTTKQRAIEMSLLAIQNLIRRIRFLFHTHTHCLYVVLFVAQLQYLDTSQDQKRSRWRRLGCGTDLMTRCHLIMSGRQALILYFVTLMDTHRPAPRQCPPPSSTCQLARLSDTWLGHLEQPVTWPLGRSLYNLGIYLDLKRHQCKCQVWPLEEILERQREVRAAGLEWTVVESIPVHEVVKRGRPRDKVIYLAHLEFFSRLGQSRPMAG